MVTAHLGLHFDDYAPIAKEIGQELGHRAKGFAEKHGTRRLLVSNFNNAIWASKDVDLVHMVASVSVSVCRDDEIQTA